MPKFFKLSSKSTAAATPTTASAHYRSEVQDDYGGESASNSNACAANFNRHPKIIEPENRLIESSTSSSLPVDSATNRTLPLPSIDQWPNENAVNPSVGERVSNFMNGFFSHIMAKGKNRRGYGRGSLKNPQQNQHNQHHVPTMPTIIEQPHTVSVKKKQNFQQPSKQTHQLSVRSNESNNTNCTLAACTAAGVVIGHSNRAAPPHAPHEKNENDHNFMAKFKRNNHQNKNSCKFYDGIMTTAADETAHNRGENQRDASKNLNLNARSTYRCGGHGTAAASDVPTDAHVIEHRKNNGVAVANDDNDDTAHLERPNDAHCVVENSLIDDELTPQRISSDCYSSTSDTSTTPLPRTLNDLYKSHDPNSTLSSSLPDRNTDCSEEDSIRIHSTEKNVDPTRDRHARRVIDSAAVAAAAAISSSLCTAAVAPTASKLPDTKIHDSGQTELDDCRHRESNFECNSERSSLNIPLILIDFVSTLNSSSLAHAETPTTSTFPSSKSSSAGNDCDMGNTQPKSKNQQNATNADCRVPYQNVVNNKTSSSSPSMRLSPTLNENKDIFYEASSELSVDDDRTPMNEIDARPTNSDSGWSTEASGGGVVDAQNHDFINKIANNTHGTASSCVGRNGGANSDAATATPIILKNQATYSCDGRSERDNSVFAATNNTAESMEKNRVYRVYDSACDGDIDYSDLEEISCTQALVTEVQSDDDNDNGPKINNINRGRRASIDDPITSWHRRHEDAVQIIEVDDGDFGSDESIDDGGKVEEIPDIHVIKVMVEGVQVLNSDDSENDENIETIEEIEEIVEVTDSSEYEEEISTEATASGGDADSSASTTSPHENDNNQSAFTKFINQPTNGNTMNYSSKYNHINNNEINKSHSFNSRRSSHTNNNHINNNNSSSSKNDVENVILFNDQPHKFSNSGINGTDTVGAVAPPSLYITSTHNNHNHSNSPNNIQKSSFNCVGNPVKKSVRFSHINSDDSDNFPNKMMKMSSVHRKDDKYQQYHANGKYGGDEPTQLPDIVVESVESTATVNHIANGIDDNEQSQSTEASSQSTGDDEESCSVEESNADDTSQGEEDEEDISTNDSVQSESEPSENEA